MPVSEEIERLVRQARAGDREAAGALWQRHRRLVATVLLAHGDVRELDDLLQEVALRVTRSLDGLADDDLLLADRMLAGLHEHLWAGVDERWAEDAELQEARSTLSAAILEERSTAGR